jgi:hypothetical protein
MLRNVIDLEGGNDLTALVAAVRLVAQDLGT